MSSYFLLQREREREKYGSKREKKEELVQFRFSISSLGIQNFAPNYKKTFVD